MDEGAETLIARYMTEGETLFMSDDYEGALSMWLKVLEIDPANEAAMMNMARAHEKLMGSPFKKVVSKEKPAPPPAAPPRPAIAPPQTEVTRKLSAPEMAAKLAEERQAKTGAQPATPAARPAAPQPAPPSPPSPAPPTPAPPKPSPAADSLKPEPEDKNLDVHLKRYLKRGVDFFNSKEYDKAIQEWAKVLRERPTHDTTLHYIRKARGRLEKTNTPERAKEEQESFDRLLKHGEEYFREGEFRMAINQLVQALMYKPDDATVIERVRKAEDALKKEGEIVKPTGPGSPRTLRHIESPPVPSGATPPGGTPRPPMGDKDKLAAAAHSIYSEMLKEEQGIVAPSAPKKPTPKPTGIKTTTQPLPSEGGGVKRLLLILIVLGGLAFIGYRVYLMVAPTDSHLEAARRFFNANMPGEAIDELAQHLAKRADDPRAYELRYQCYAHDKLKDYANASKDIQKLISLQPTEKKWVAAYGDMLIKGGDFAGATKPLEVQLQTVGTDEDRKKIYDQLITCYINAKNPAKVIEYVELYLKLDPDRTELIQIKGEMQFSLNRFTDAQATIKQAISKGVKDLPLFFKLYKSYMIQGNLPGAKRAVEDALATQQSADLCFVLARLTYMMGDLEGALKMIEQGMTIDSARWRGYAELGFIWLKEWRKHQDEDNAGRTLKAFDAAKERATIDGRLSLAEGVALAVLKKEQQSDLRLEEASKHVESSVLDDYGYPYQCLANLMRRDYSSAISGLDQVLAGDPNNIAAWTLKGYVMVESGNVAGGGAAFIKSFEVQSEQKKVLVPMETIFRNKDDLEAKMRIAALKLEPDQSKALLGYVEAASAK
ncbi:MAG: hypothetical protein U0166_21940 [Acidobacteriota bacterium]